MLGMWSGWAGYIRGEDDSLFRFLYSLFVIPLYVYFSCSAYLSILFSVLSCRHSIAVLHFFLLGY